MTAETTPDAHRARNHVEAGDISSSLAYGQIAVAENLGAIQSTLADLTELAAKALGTLLDGNDIYALTDTPSSRIELADRTDRLADVLRETYEAHNTGTPIWRALAAAAIQHLED